ncbi:Uncharacterized protein TCM_035735 [Theobroma cacao]|uniref:UBN2 domain-containing protein n=1 Tax=Theobroma cacao TaxID=3641 RepID=A0A061FJJ1_THECC|nr:Uncharacterized protein TCM_035735 [Theobroma cacao]
MKTFFFFSHCMYVMTCVYRVGFYTTYERTNQFKESKIVLPTHDYELFRMKEDKSINMMFERFTSIVGGLKALGKDFPNALVVKKILFSLPKFWRLKVTTIEEARNLNNFKLEELICFLLTYEMIFKYDSERKNQRRKTSNKKE